MNRRKNDFSCCNVNANAFPRALRSFPMEGEGKLDIKSTTTCHQHQMPSKTSITNQVLTCFCYLCLDRKKAVLISSNHPSEPRRLSVNRASLASSFAHLLPRVHLTNTTGVTADQSAIMPVCDALHCASFASGASVAHTC